ncbi:hypothetical protein [Arcobacter sp.]|uniref:hypothetical protein n=1 Tax=Arcobacter sp. TaxID=1872629 RepID=UPI003D0A2F01
MNYRKSEYLELPHGNTIIWRYMNHSKLQRMINDSSIYFANANILTDKYEVSIPASTYKNQKKLLEKSGFKGRELEEELFRFYWETNPMKNLVLINCWSVNPFESYALWKIYLGGEKNGIAIKSTVSKLRKAIEKGKDNYPEDFFISKVKYKKHLNSDELSRFTVISTKKPFYDFEKELRIFILNYPRSEGGTNPPYDLSKGRNVRVDLDILVHEIYISPFSDTKYKEEIRKLFSNKNFINERFIIKESEIRDI